MATSANLYAVNLDEIAQAIIAGGHQRTILVQGHMGTGKSSCYNMLSAELPKHVACYFDCTTKDLGDITIPDIMHMDDGSGFVRYLTNEELGAHHDKPIILMIDEFGKSNPAVKLALLRMMLERKIGSYTLHPDSIVFATTNLGAEGVGDLLPAHALQSLDGDRVYQANVGAVDRVGYQQRVSTRLCWGGVATTTRRLPTSAMCKIPRTTTIYSTHGLPVRRL